MMRYGEPLVLALVLGSAPDVWAHGGHGEHVMGTVQAIDAKASAITVETRDQKVVAVLWTEHTKFVKGEAAAAAQDLATGDRVVIHAEKKGADLVAESVKFAPSHAGAPAAPKAVVYTCPMHPEVRSDKPGRCPTCGMTLVPVEGGDKDKQK